MSLFERVFNLQEGSGGEKALRRKGNRLNKYLPEEPINTPWGKGDTRWAQSRDLTVRGKYRGTERAEKSLYGQDKRAEAREKPDPLAQKQALKDLANKPKVAPSFKSEDFAP